MKEMLKRVNERRKSVDNQPVLELYISSAVVHFAFLFDIFVKRPSATIWRTSNRTFLFPSVQLAEGEVELDDILSSRFE
jgi:hypothetical protein